MQARLPGHLPRKFGLGDGSWPMSGTRRIVCALGDRRGPGGGEGGRRRGSPLPLSRLPRREDLASRFGNSVRAVTGDRLVWGALNSKGSTRMSLFQTADRIDYSIRRYIHATDHLWSPPLRRSRANGAPQSKLISAPDRSVWLSIGHYLRVQYDALSAPVPPHITALVEQLEMRK